MDRQKHYYSDVAADSLLKKIICYNKSINMYKWRVCV